MQNPKSKIDIEVTINKDGSYQDSGTNSYTSPVPTYSGPNSLVVTYRWLNSPSFADVKINSNGSFNVKVSKGDVNSRNAMDYTLLINYGDVTDASIKTLSVLIKVNFDDLSVASQTIGA